METEIRNRQQEEGGNSILERMYYQGMQKNRENDFVHNPYNHELREDEAIRHGDEEELRLILAEDFPGRFGVLAENPLRAEINLGIVNVTTASRAAIEGGLRYEKAYTLSDICIQQMEKCQTPEEVRKLYNDVKLQYARLVHEARESRENTPEEGGSSETDLTNWNVERCKDYICAHLHGKITVIEIAHAIGLDPNYLSSLFCKCEKITIKHYIMKEKIKLVQKALVHSSSSYADIAIYFGFSSQSHMGAELKKLTGLTPRQYRERYSKEDFLGNQQRCTG